MHLPISSPRQRAIVAVLAFAGMLISLQLTLLIPALPQIPQILSVTANDASWLVTITLLTSTVGTPILSRMADMYGRRRLLLASLALLATGSVIAALGMNFMAVLIGRSLQGFAASIIPIGVSLMRDLLTPQRSATGIALVSGTMGIGSAIGLPLSGILLEVGGLSAIFWASAIAATLFFILSVMILPIPGVPLGGRFDFVGSFLFAAPLSSLLLLISKGSEWGVGMSTGICLLITLIGFAIWIPHQLKTSNPLVELRSTVSRPVLTTNIATFFIAAGMFANYLLTIQEATAPVGMGMGLGLPALQGALIIVPSSLMMVLLSPLAAKVLRTYGGKTALVLGAALICFAYTFRFFFNSGIPAVIVGTMFVGVGATFAFAAMPTLIMGMVPSSQAAAANGLNSLIRNLAGAVTTAAYGFLFIVLPWEHDSSFLSSEGILVGFGVMAILALIGLLIAGSLPKPQQSPEA